MRRRGLRVVVLAALTALVVTGGAACTQAPSVGPVRPTSAAPAPSEAPMSPAQARALAAQKKAAGIAACPSSDPTTAAVPGGLPDVVLSCLGGGSRVRLAGLRGRPMILNVWAQWCSPCRHEAPYLAAVAAGNHSRAVILGVDFVDPRPDLAIEFSRLSGWTYPQLADTDRVLAAPLQILGPPYTFFVRADGTVAGKHVGPFTSADQIRTMARQQLGVEL